MNINNPLDELLQAKLIERINQDLLRRERRFRQILQQTVEVLEQTRRSFRSKQLKQLREEIESVLRSEYQDFTS